MHADPQAQGHRGSRNVVFERNHHSTGQAVYDSRHYMVVLRQKRGALCINTLPRNHLR